MWFTENAWTPAALFTVAAVVALVYAVRTGRRTAYAVAAGAVVAVAAAFAVDQFVVTEREVVADRVDALAAAVVEGEVGPVLDFFSPTAVVERGLVAVNLAVVDVREDLRITDVDVRLTAADSQAVSRFRANATVSVGRVGYEGRQPTFWELVWRREGDPAAWKVVEVRRLNPVTGEVIGFQSGTR